MLLATQMPGTGLPRSRAALRGSELHLIADDINAGSPSISIRRSLIFTPSAATCQHAEECDGSCRPRRGGRQQPSRHAQAFVEWLQVKLPIKSAYVLWFICRLHLDAPDDAAELTGNAS